MKLSQLAAKPKLVPVILDDEDTIKEFGEAIEFFTWDRQPMDVFMRLANANAMNTAEQIDIVRTLILNDEGHQIISDDNMLPSFVLIRAIARIVETLGK